tara:strand:+ start:2748 stop:3131 length:384 start_codon:yes stop_codon:yes gene_type:complete
MGLSKKQDIRFIGYEGEDSEVTATSPLITIYTDLICEDGKDSVSKIGILGTKPFKKKPRKCPCCKEESIMGIEVLGAYKGALLWQCMSCCERYLRFGKTYTNKLLEEVKDSYTVPEDWGYLPPEKFS